MRDYEGLARDAIQAGHEGPKIDFKERVDFSGKKDVVELAKLVLAMANTDSDEFEDLGLIIIGARRKELVGGCDRFAEDSFCASLPTRLNQYIEPDARIEAKGFQDPDKGWFGAILVKPNRAVRPHFVKKDFTDEKRVVVRRNECYVRNGESTELASRADFDRMYTQRFGTELDRVRDLINPEPSPHIAWIDAGAHGVLEVPPRGEYLPIVLDEPFSPEELAELSPEHRAKAQTFNDDRIAYLEAAREAEPGLRAAFYREHHSQLLWAKLVNHGEAPLEKPTCFVTVPPEFDLHSPTATVEPPKLPVLPRRPRFAAKVQPAGGIFSAFDRMNDLYRIGARADMVSLASVHSRFEIPDMHKGGFHVEGPRKVWAWVDRLKHGGFSRSWKDPIVLVPPATEGLYSLEYEIHADNLRRPRKGRLEIRVRNGAERRRQRTVAPDED